MAGKSELIEQTRLAFDFIQKLFLEVSYMIKEAEAIYREEPEEFVIGKPGGYAISIRNSKGLDTVNVDLWLYKKFAVFFVPKENTEVKGGQQSTKIIGDLKVIYMRVVLQDRSVTEPTVFSGILYNIKRKRKVNWFTKFEHCMGHLEYCDEKLLQTPKNIKYDDAYVSFNGKLLNIPLFDINSSEAIREKIVLPTLDLFRR
jgi:hypothetical protein